MGIRNLRARRRLLAGLLAGVVSAWPVLALGVASTGETSPATRACTPTPAPTPTPTPTPATPTPTPATAPLPTPVIAGRDVTPAVPRDYSGETVVTAALLGPSVEEQGLRVLCLPPDGNYETAHWRGLELRRTLPPRGAEAFFYLDVADGFIHDGINEVELTVAYLDAGFGPLYVDYHAIDPRQPWRQDPALRSKRVELARRANSEAWKTARLRLTDARFAGAVRGVDLRIGGSDAVTLMQVGVWRIKSAQPPPPVQVLIEGRALTFTDAFPIIENSRVLVPMRALFEGLGAVVRWDGATRAAEGERDGRRIRLLIGSNQATVDGQTVHLDVPAQIYADRTFVPLRFVSEALGSEVQWDGVTRTVTVGAPAPAPAVPLPGLTPGSGFGSASDSASGSAPGSGFGSTSGSAPGDVPGSSAEGAPPPPSLFPFPGTRGSGATGADTGAADAAGPVGR